jgi:RNA polymerase sigma-70 factor (ECF subfamily)
MALTEEQEFIRQLLDPVTQNAAFQQMVRQYQRPLYNQIRSIVLNHDDADDVLQNTFVKVFRYLKDFKGDSKLFSWIYRIATNESLSFLKQKSKNFKMTGETLQTRLVENLSADSFFDGDALQFKLQKAVALLPEKQQLVFKMKYYQEMKYEDISEILGTSVGGLKASYHHAVKKIEDYMNRELNH